MEVILLSDSVLGDCHKNNQKIIFIFNIVEANNG